MSAPRLFLLLVWHPEVGASLDPVGVLATQSNAEGLEWAVSWVPHTEVRAWPWRHRLTEPPTWELVEYWLEQNGTLQLVEVPASEAASLSHLVEGALDELLVGLAESEA